MSATPARPARLSALDIRARAPSACTIPTPPSVEALPRSRPAGWCTPRRGPLRSRRRDHGSSPKRLEDTTGQPTQAADLCHLDDRLSPRRAYDAATCSPVGPNARQPTRSNPHARRLEQPVAAVATGNSRTSTSGGSMDTRGEVSATSAADRLPLNLSGASDARHGGAPGVSPDSEEGGGCVGGRRRKLLELGDVVDLGAHRHVGDPLQDDLDHDRDPMLGDQLLRLLECRCKLVRLEHADRLAAKAFRDLHVVDAVGVESRAC